MAQLPSASFGELAQPGAAWTVEVVGTVRNQVCFCSAVSLVYSCYRMNCVPKVTLES